MEGPRRIAWAESRRGGSEKFSVGMRIICYLATFSGGFNFANIGGVKPLKFQRMSWRTFWFLFLFGILILQRANQFPAGKAFFEGGMKTGRYSETDVRANYVQLFWNFSGALLSCIYWIVGGQALCDLFNEALDLDRRIGMDERRRWPWVVGVAVYCCLWAVALVFGNPVRPLSLWTVPELFAMAVVGFNATTQPLLYAWLCSQMVRFQRYMTREMQEKRMSGEEWLEGRKRLESLAKKLDQIYGRLVIIHLARNAVLATVAMFFIVRSIAAYGLGAFMTVTYAVGFTFSAIPILIFHLAAEPVIIQEDLFWRTTAAACTESALVSVKSFSRTSLHLDIPTSRKESHFTMEADGCYKLRRIRPTAAGFFHLGHGPVAELSDVILTYIVVLFQFNQDDLKTKA